MSLFRKIEERVLTLSAPISEWDKEFDGVRSAKTASGTRVDQWSSRHFVAVYACQSWIADGISTLPLDTFRDIDGKRKPINGPAWVKQPNPFETATSFWHKVVISLLSDGNAFIATMRNDRGAVVALYVLDPQMVSVDVRPDGEPYYTIDREYDRSEILHIPGFTVAGCLRGLSPIDHARESIGLGLTAEEFGARFFSQGTTMSGVIEHPKVPQGDEAKVLREMFRKSHSGVKNSHAVGVLTGGATFKPISLTNEQAQFLETRKFQKQDIALLYHVPVYVVDPTVTSTWGTGVEEQNKWAVDSALMPWIIRIEQALSTYLLPPRQFVKFNLDARLRAKTKERYESYSVAIQNGFMNPDTALALEDMDPIPGGAGQKFFVPANIVPIEKAGEKQTAPAPGDVVGDKPQGDTQNV